MALRTSTRTTRPTSCSISDDRSGGIAHHRREPERADRHPYSGVKAQRPPSVPK